MTSIQILFLGFCVLGLFGSLSLVTPHVLWNDLTYFFRKDRKERIPRVFQSLSWKNVSCHWVDFFCSFFSKLGC